mgnify:FL=1
MALHQESSYERLYRWAQSKVSFSLVCVFNVNEQNYKCQWVPVLLPE